MNYKFFRNLSKHEEASAHAITNVSVFSYFVLQLALSKFI